MHDVLVRVEDWEPLTLVFVRGIGPTIIKQVDTMQVEFSDALNVYTC